MSGEKLLTLAEKENKSNIKNIYDLLFGIVDLFSLILIILPLYPNTIDGYVYSVNLLSYTQVAELNKIIYWIMFVLLVIVGILKVLLTRLNVEKGNKILAEISIVISILMVLFLALAREVYAVVVAFLLLMVKGILLLKYVRLG